MRGPPGYAVGQFDDPEREVARLREQATVVAEAEAAAFRELGFPGSGLALDVGCGPGFVAGRFRDRSGGLLNVVGVDLDRAVLARARQGASLAVTNAAATSLPFATASFDCAYARLVLRYVPRPDVAIRELARIVKPGGRVFVLDSDDGALLVHPEPDGFAETLRARHESLRRRGSDPAFARKLPTLLTGCGLEDVAGRTLTVSSLAAGAGAFAGLVLGPVAEAIDADLQPPERTAEARAAIRRWAEQPGAFGMTTALLVSGRRPDEARS